MNRRDFLKMMAAAGVAVKTPVAMSNGSLTASPYTGQIFLTIYASAGWDTSSFCDPKQDPAINSWAETKNIHYAGNLPCAPLANASNEAFYDKYYTYMRVINGINFKTNGHWQGARNIMTNQMDEGYPAFPALFAACKDPSLPMAYITSTSGSAKHYQTSGLVALTRMPSHSVMGAIANPNVDAAGNPYFDDWLIKKIRQHSQDKMNAISSSDTSLPRAKSAAEKIYLARDGRNLFDAFGQNAPTSFDDTHEGIKYSRITTAHMMLVAAQSGICSGAMINSQYGFDHHSDFDSVNGHPRAFKYLTNLIDYVWEKAAELNIDNRLTIMVTSDFSRTPWYNKNNGKDHWPIGSAILMQKNAPWGNSVVGVSGPAHQKAAIDPSTFQPVPDINQGMVIEPNHLHYSMRKLMGIESHPFCQQYPIDSQYHVDLFDPGKKTV